MHKKKTLALVAVLVFSGGSSHSFFAAEAAVPKEFNSQIQSDDIHLTPKNLAFRYKDMFMAANVVGYNYIGGMLLPLSFTADLMGAYVEVDYQKGTAEGWIESPDNAFLLDLPNRTLLANGQERVVPRGVITVVGQEMYVDASYLATILPVNYLVSFETNIIELQPQKDLRVFQRMDFMNRYFENIRKQAGLPYEPWTLEDAVAAATVERPIIQQPVLPKSMVQDPRSISSGAKEAISLAGGGVPIESPYGTAGVSQTAPVGAVEGSSLLPQITASQAEGGITENEAIIDEAQEVLRALPGQYIALDTSEQQGALQAEGNPVLDDNKLLILQPQLNSTKGDYIEAYQHGKNGLYLPLGYLMDMLDLGVGVNPATMEASGFVVSEDNTFYLNGKTNEAIIKGERMTFPEGLVIANPFELYVDASLLSQLLPLDFQLNISNLALIILPRETLPIEAGLERSNKWQKLEAWKNAPSDPYKNIPIIETPYKAATVPFADVQLNNTYQSKSGNTNSLASVVAAGDLGYLSAETFAVVNRDDDDVVSTLRFKAGRQDRDGNLLGPLHAKEAYVGDVQSYPLPLVSSSQLGRGAKVSNRDLIRPNQFDRTDFYGDAQPGWEVELYRNNVLIDFQVVGDDGRYAFTEVPINYGDNTFRIVQYGPQGQKQEEVREFNIDDRMPAPGEVEYSVSVNEAQVGLIDLDSGAGANVFGASGPNIIGSAEVGVRENLSIGAGYGHVPVQDALGNVGEYDFATANLRTSIYGINTNFISAYDISNGGWATGVSGLARYGTTTLRGEQRFYEDFNSAERLRSFVRPLTLDEIINGLQNVQAESRLKTRTDFSANRPLTLPKLGNVSGSANFVYETYEAGESDLTLSGRLSKNYLGSNFASSLRYRSLDRLDQGTENYVDGSLSVRHDIYDDLQLRAAARYQFVPDLSLSAINVSLQKQINEDVNARLEYIESFSGFATRRITGYLNWDFGDFYLSPRLEVDENFDYLVGLGLQFSVGMDSRTNNWNMTSERMANSGAISALAFLDENADGTKDANEPVLENVTFNNKSHTTNEDGLAFIPRLTAFQPNRLMLDKNSVVGQGATPKEAAYAVIARPGITSEIDYPVVPTLEIEGAAFLDTGGERLEYPGLQLELINADGEVIRELRTEFDGYYYIGDIFPGTYTLQVAQKEIEAKNLVVNSFDVDTSALRGDGSFEGYVTDYDFIVTRAAPDDSGTVMVANAPDTTEASEVIPVDAADGQEVAAVPQIPVTAPSSNVKIEPEAVAQIQDEVEVSVLPTKPVPDSYRKVFVQAGMYCDYGNAQKQLDTLTIAGFEVSLKGRNYKGRPCYVVHVGPAQDLAAAEGITQQLQEMGVDKPVIVEENSQVYE